MRYLCIPDLHGHYDELVELFSLCMDAGFDPEKDTAVFLGDYVDGGSQTKQIIEWLQAMKKAYPHWIYLLGNHERMMQHAFEFKSWRSAWDMWYWQGGAETYASYDGNEQEMQHAIEWFKSFPLYYESDNHIFVHAGLRPNLPLSAQTENDMLWIREEFIGSAFDWGKRVIYGHTATTVPNIQRNKIGLDTKPREQGFLCAALIDDSNQHNCQIIYPPKAKRLMQARQPVHDWALEIVDGERRISPLTYE